MAKSKIVQANEKVAGAVVGGYKRIEEGVVGGYKKIEEGATDAFKKVEDGFVDKFLTHEGETVEDAKKRLAEEQAQRGTTTKAAGGQPGPNKDKSSLEKSLKIGRASVEASRHPGKH